MQIKLGHKALALRKKATASQRAIATGTQILNSLGGFRKGITGGYPQQIHPQTKEEINPGATAEEFRQAAVDAFGEEIVAKLEKSAAIFADADEPAKQSPAPVAGTPGRPKR